MRDLLLQDNLCQRLQALLLRHYRTRPAFLLVRPVNILKSDQRFRTVNRLRQLIRHFSLFFNGRAYRRLSVLQVSQIPQSLAQITNLLVIQFSVLLLAVPGDKRDRISLVNQANHRLHLPRLNLQFLRNLFCNIHRSNTPILFFSELLY